MYTVNSIRNICLLGHSGSGKTVYENVNIVYAYCTSAQAVTEFENVIALCEYVKKEMSQEAVTLEYNGQVKFI